MCEPVSAESAEHILNSCKKWQQMCEHLETISGIIWWLPARLCLYNWVCVCLCGCFCVSVCLSVCEIFCVEWNGMCLCVSPWMLSLCLCANLCLWSVCCCVSEWGCLCLSACLSVSLCVSLCVCLSCLFCEVLRVNCYLNRSFRLQTAVSTQTRTIKCGLCVHVGKLAFLFAVRWSMVEVKG